MREIKFRAWDNDNKIMVDVYEMEWMEGKLWATCIPHFETTSGLLRKRVLCTSTNPILQYTGLKDKNGKEIYEGDIYKQIWKGEQVIGVITYGDMARFWLKPYDHYSIGEIKITGEVIGNVWENPELVTA